MREPGEPHHGPEDWRDAIPDDRRCVRCGHVWPHGAVLVTADLEGREVPRSAVWAEDFCDDCDDPCPDNAARRPRAPGPERAPNLPPGRHRA